MKVVIYEGLTVMKNVITTVEFSGEKNSEKCAMAQMRAVTYLCHGTRFNYSY